MPAKDLSHYKSFVNADSQEIKILSVEQEFYDVPVEVYNFEVKDWHTYFVSDEKLLVHNSCKMFENGDSATTDQILAAAISWLGEGYYEYASGIYVSSNGTRVFRMTNSDFKGVNDSLGRPHVHFSLYAFAFGTKDNIEEENNHVYIEDE